MSNTITADELRSGVTIMHGAVRVTILDDDWLPWQDRFGQQLRKIWAQHEDGHQGWYGYGPKGVFVLADDEHACKGEGDYDSLCDNCKESRDNERDAV